MEPEEIQRQNRGSRGLGHVLRSRRTLHLSIAGICLGVIAGGPFGVNQSPPYVNAQQCSVFGYETCPVGLQPVGQFAWRAAFRESGDPFFAERGCD